MTRGQAQSLAERERDQHAVPGTTRVTSVDQRFIELVEVPRGESTMVFDVLVWVVRFARGSVWVDLAVADSTGAIVRVRRSRSSR